MLRSVFMGASPAELWDSSLCGGTRLPGNRELSSYLLLAAFPIKTLTSRSEGVGSCRNGGFGVSELRVRTGIPQVQVRRKPAAGLSLWGARTSEQLVLSSLLPSLSSFSLSLSSLASYVAFLAPACCY